MPQSKREEVAAIVSLMVYTQGIFFDARTLSKLPYERSLVWRVVDALVKGGVIERVDRGKYALTDSFTDSLRREITWKMPRGALVSLPDLKVFDVSGIDRWDEEELVLYTVWLKRHWASLRAEKSKARENAGGWERSVGRQALVATLATTSRNPCDGFYMCKSSHPLRLQVGTLATSGVVNSSSSVSSF